MALTEQQKLLLAIPISFGGGILVYKLGKEIIPNWWAKREKAKAERQAEIYADALRRVYLKSGDITTLATNGGSPLYPQEGPTLTDIYSVMQEIKVRQDDQEGSIKSILEDMKKYHGDVQ